MRSAKRAPAIFSHDLSRSPQVLTFREFAARGGYDHEISHDMLRFPHGISKIQAKRNRNAAAHHLNEAIRAMKDYAAAVEAGDVRPPDDNEQRAATIAGHPDHESVKATWRLLVKRACRADPSLSPLSAVENIISDRLNGIDPWAPELGLTVETEPLQIAAARLVWMGLGQAAA